ncbi:4Fe-4S dicluster-binding protein [Bacillus sp. EB600]|uniref:4Fe-4S dicluster-binding protein n=1 Tax=Bacillus sp. EB600 TaxID=2806345 RepID=UPI0028116D5B|nr:4Fe-4S dicluster-binding protein [Bacillus sp. EB600]
MLKIKKQGFKKDQLIVNEDTCTGCNLCALVCPVEGAMDMVEVPAKEKPVTWNEIKAFSYFKCGN